MVAYGEEAKQALQDRGYTSDIKTCKTCKYHDVHRNKHFCYSGSEVVYLCDGNIGCCTLHTEEEE